MPPWAEQQGAFAGGLLDPARSAPAGLVDPEGLPCPKRYGVYRNNVVTGLVEVLAESFPAVRRVVGEDFFRAMASAYVRRDPPLSPVLLDYGSGFPAFIEAFPPAAELPYLADVARLERLWLEAYHAPDAEPLDGADFAALPPDLLGDLRLDLHPSLRILRSPHPALAIWGANLAEDDPGPLGLTGDGEDLLVIRPEGDVTVRAMAEGAADLLPALGQGRSIVEAFEAARSSARGFDLAAALAELIPAGAFVGYRLPRGDEP
jgi:hypothetical protein